MSLQWDTRGVAILGFGENGSGKSTGYKNLAEQLTQGGLTVQVFTSSKYVLPILRLRHPGRNPEQYSREEFNDAVLATDDARGRAWLAKLMCQEMAASIAQIKIWDGGRRPVDRKIVRKYFKRNVDAYITANEMLRYERITLRGEKANEKDLTHPQFLAQDRLPTNVLIPMMGLSAPLRFYNEGTMRDLANGMRAWIDILDSRGLLV